MSFAELSSLTDRHAITRTFTDLEAERVISSLRGQGDFLQAQQPAPSIKQLEYLMKREVNLRLHAVTLAEYFNVKRIPRGLRILLKPSLCRENEGFLDKWREILNKCSLDLLILTIQELQKSLATVGGDIEEAKTKFQDSVSNDVWMKEYADLTKVIENHKAEVQRTKLRKFKRDTYDYLNDCVYTWADRLDEVQRRRTFRTQVGEQASSSSSLDSDYRGTPGPEGGPTTSTGEFAQLSRGPTTPFLDRGVRRGGRAGGARNLPRENYPYTRSQRR